MRKLIDLVLKCINMLIPKKNNKIIFSSMPDYSDNPKALYEYIKKTHNEDYDLVWIAYNQEVIEKLRKNNVEVYDRKSLKGILSVWRAKYIVSSHYNLLSVKSKNQVYINLWHGMPLKTMGFIENKVNLDLKNKDLKNRKREIDNINYMSATSKIMKLALATCFYIDPRKILVFGQSRNDYLYLKKYESNNKLQKIVKTKNINDYEKIILYMPTIRKGLGGDVGSFENNIINILEYNQAEFENYLKENNYLFLIKLHPAEETAFESLESENIYIIKSKDMTCELVTVNEILRSTDLLITDYSSVYFDYLNIDKPIIFINTDEKIYKEDRGFIFDNDQIWRPGPKINKMNELKNEITSCINNKNYYKEERDLVDSFVNQYHDDKSSERIFNYIFR